jgi:hypothetical protein
VIVKTVDRNYRVGNPMHAEHGRKKAERAFALPARLLVTGR